MSDGFSRKAKAKLRRILKGNDALIADLEISLVMWRLLMPHEAEMRERLSPGTRKDLKRLLEAVETLRQEVGRGPTDAGYRVSLELVRRGLFGVPSAAVDKVREILDELRPVIGEVPEGHREKAVLLALAKHSAKEREAGNRPSAFLDALDHDLGQLAEVLGDLLSGARGRPRERMRPMVAASVAQVFRRHGIEPTTSWSGAYAQVLKIALGEAGDDASDKVERLVRTGITGIDDPEPGDTPN